MNSLALIKQTGEAGARTLLSLARIPLMCRPVRWKVSPRREVLILGNGPSLKDFLDRKAAFGEGKSLLAVNHFVETAYFERLRPEMYVLAAPEYWLRDIDEDFRDKRRRIFHGLSQRTAWPLEVFMPVAARHNTWWKEVLERNPHIRIQYYNTMPVEGFRAFRESLFGLRCGMPRPHNVLIPSLMIALWAGAQKIWLAGADHNWMKEIFVAPDNRVFLTQKHFYDAQSARPEVMKKLGKGQRKLHEMLEKFYYSFRSYHIIEQWAQRRGAEIYNITPGSWIDAFRRQEAEI